MNLEHVGSLEYVYRKQRLSKIHATFAPLVAVGSELIPLHIGELSIDVKYGKGVEQYRLLPQLHVVQDGRFSCVTIGTYRIVLGEIGSLYTSDYHLHPTGYISRSFDFTPVLIRNGETPRTLSGKHHVYPAGDDGFDGKSYRVRYSYGGDGIGWFTRVEYL